MIINEVYINDSVIASMVFVPAEYRNYKDRQKIKRTSHVRIALTTNRFQLIHCTKEQYLLALESLKDYHPATVSPEGDVNE